MRSTEEIEALLDKFESFIKSYEDADNEYQTNQRRENWKSKYGERFKPYEDKIKKLNGDDFDLMEESRNEYESQYSDLTDDEYCNALENNIKTTLKRIWPDADEGQIEQAIDEVEESIDEVEETTKDEEPDDSKGDEAEVEVEITKDGDEDGPLENFTRELEETKKALPKRK